MKYFVLFLFLYALPEVKHEHPVYDCDECRKQCEESPFKIYELLDQIEDQEL